MKQDKQCSFCINKIKSPKYFITIYSDCDNNGSNNFRQKIEIITEPKTIYFDLAKGVNNTLLLEIDFINQLEQVKSFDPTPFCN